MVEKERRIQNRSISQLVRLLSVLSFPASPFSVKKYTRYQHLHDVLLLSSNISSEDVKLTCKLSVGWVITRSGDLPTLSLSRREWTLACEIGWVAVAARRLSRGLCVCVSACAWEKEMKIKRGQSHSLTRITRQIKRDGRTSKTSSL